MPAETEPHQPSCEELLRGLLAVVAVAVRAFGLGKGVLRYAERLASHDATLRRLGGIRATVVGQLGRLVPAGLPRTGRGEMLSSVVDDVESKSSAAATVTLALPGPTTLPSMSSMDDASVVS